MSKELSDFGSCPFATTQMLLQGKWSILILHHLSEGTLRFGELQAKMPEVTHSTLSSQLKKLEDEGLVRRTVFAEAPPRVEYALTEIGEQFKPVLKALDVWGTAYIAYLDARNN